ncbi:MAG: T9SS type A sorting domain-containing protein, partial [Flavobacteriales bacterium]|nr:T9SS type A sorting domain-containing protein [Flavobacteriales bacterium]
REVDGATIRVVDVFGKQLEQYILTNTDKHILKRNNKASGVYFVEIEVEGTEKYIKKLIIE